MRIEVNYVYEEEGQHELTLGVFDTYTEAVGFAASLCGVLSCGNLSYGDDYPYTEVCDEDEARWRAYVKDGGRYEYADLTAQGGQGGEQCQK